MTRDPAIYVTDIVETMALIQRFVEAMSFEAFAADAKTHFAVVRGLTILGEAAKQVPSEVQARCPEVAWREMAGMRDKVTHGYRGVDLEIAWRAIHERFPIELPALHRLLEELGTEPTNDA
jgi:uncharacterized protein with HEPN domain